MHSPKNIVMQRNIILIISLLSFQWLYAQKDVAETAAKKIPKYEEADSTQRAWEYEVGVGLFASQVVFINWATGGVNSISGVINADAFLRYNKGKHNWETDFKAEWGVVKNEDKPLLKNKDNFILSSKYGYKLDKRKTLFAGFMLNFQSQFTEGKKPEEENYSTNFMAPAHLTIATGIDWKPSKYFSLFFSPIAGKFTFVTDNGVDETAFGLEKGKDIRAEFGAYAKIEFKKELFKRVVFQSTLTLFNNFLDNSVDSVFLNNKRIQRPNRWNIDVDWRVGVDLLFNNWLSVKLSTHLIYDHDVKIAIIDKSTKMPVLNADGSPKTAPRTQFSEALNIGITYRFKPKQKK